MLMTTITGGCFCKAIQYRIKTGISMAVNCHCNVCRKAGGGAFSSHAVVRERRFEIVSGEENLSSFHLGESVTKHFCRHCGTPVFNSNKRYPGHRMVALGSLDDPTVVTPTANIHCDSQLSWVTLDEQLQNFPQDYS